MKKTLLLLTLIWLTTTTTACAGRAAAYHSTPTANGEGTSSAMFTATPTPTPTLAPPTLTPTPRPTSTPTFTPTPTFDPASWQSLPIIPTVSETARRIYRTGQSLGNDPHAFSVVGDCLSLSKPVNNLFGNFSRPGHYNLGEYSYLQPVIDWFQNSFDRQYITVGNGFNTAAVLSPLRADPDQCQPSETPLACEYRLHRPSYVLISIGTDDYETPPEIYEQRMRWIVQFFISKGVVPILATKADNREGGHAFNIIVARLAYEYDIPLWNFWAAVQPLPNHGLADSEQGWLTWGNPTALDEPYAMWHAIPVRNVTALQTLDAVWRGVTAP